MFGYVRPYRPELKCKELDLYKATYCGLCCTLRQRYGMLAPMFLSFDFTFLALLLEEPSAEPEFCKGRCHGNFFVKKKRTNPSLALECCSDFTVILAWFQLQDRIIDERGIKAVMARVVALFLKPSFKKAKLLRSEFAELTEKALLELQDLEQNNCASMDQVADCFAKILQEALPDIPEQGQKRCLQLLLYHLGRWIYLIDARDDLEDDVKNESYNPLPLRYQGKCDDEAFVGTLGNSLSLSRSALGLLDLGCRQGLVENVLDIGLPVVQNAVVQGCWQKKKKEKIWRKMHE